MFNPFEKPTRITEDDPLTISEMYEVIRINSLPQPLQRIALTHAQDQWQAEPSIVEQSAEKIRRSSLRQ
jgi:hypothetical protein